MFSVFFVSLSENVESSSMSSTFFRPILQLWTFGSGVADGGTVPFCLPEWQIRVRYPAAAGLLRR